MRERVTLARLVPERGRGPPGRWLDAATRNGQLSARTAVVGGAGHVSVGWLIAERAPPGPAERERERAHLPMLSERESPTAPERWDGPGCVTTQCAVLGLGLAELDMHGRR